MSAAAHNFPAQESVGSGIIIHGLLWENDDLRDSMAEAWGGAVMEEAQYQSSLAGQTDIISSLLIHYIGAMDIPNIHMGIFIDKTTSR